MSFWSPRLVYCQLRRDREGTCPDGLALSLPPSRFPGSHVLTNLSLLLKAFGSLCEAIVILNINNCGLIISIAVIKSTPKRDVREKISTQSGYYQLSMPEAPGLVAYLLQNCSNAEHHFQYHSIVALPLDADRAPRGQKRPRSDLLREIKARPDFRRTAQYRLRLQGFPEKGHTGHCQRCYANMRVSPGTYHIDELPVAVEV